ncbi:methyltransferase domain-containing protein [Nonomuraea sp. MCN248]|uniref:Methyltransferase domain-containing protein n=1 Tax=Nonomuraea corallina TaxID=2989783 RepID=A0ABT4S6F5_9ACTN|nr:methyltransferase domain-containing protein [Nonomuraea corallina]MDA0632773.1 methyltransferase domain-containing protein [Nonomuraea corallina]
MDTSTYKKQVADVFDTSAATYDRMGVEFFTPMGRRLVELAAPARGERVLDIGCGRGASLFPAAERVGPSGYVLGIDVAPAMVAEARAEIEARALGNAVARVMDGERPELPDRSFDVVQGGYSIIFLPDAPAALARYGKLLVKGGRIAFSSPVFKTGIFPFLPPEFTPLIPRELLGHLPPEWQPEALVRRFNSWLERPEDLAATLERAGFCDVAVLDEPVRMTAASAEQWVDWSHTQGMRLLWQHLPAPQAAELRERLIGGLEALRRDGGPLVIDVPVRFVTARVAR